VRVQTAALSDNTAPSYYARRPYPTMTMVRDPQHPQPPQFSPLGPFQHPNQASPPDPLLPNAPAYDQRSLAPQPLPQRYAFPLSRHTSYHSQSSEHGHERTKPPEHMLRRKTPNGILAAAYDGTSVEETEKPHATKHILLPVTAESNMRYGPRQDMPLRSPALNEYGHVKHAGTPEWSPSLYFETGSGRGHVSGQPALPQIDSMLNQMPPLQSPFQYQMYGQPFCGAFEPSLQSPLGPTVSNDQGPFGPYWHDGTFIPYRPAALRDPRYYSHHGPQWNIPQQNGYMLKGMGDWHSYTNSAVPPTNNPQHNPYHLHHLPNAYNNVGRPSIDYSQPYQQHHHNPSIEYQHQSSLAPLGQHMQQEFSLSSSGQTTPIQDHTPISTPLSEFGPQSNNGQTRERVFAWAHTVYVDLLKYLQSTRKNSAQHSSNGQQHSPRPHIYPKPPRQPAANFSNTPSNGTNNHPPFERQNSYPFPPKYQSASQDAHGPSPSHGDAFYRAPDSTHHRSSSMWSQGTANARDVTLHRHSWQPLPTQQFTNPHAQHSQAQGMEPPRHLRRMSGTSVAGVHQSLRHEPPSMTAASALEAITKHCEESKWNWIDGMLLGGCLAYALGDYQKAQDWYKHILTLDKE
jgi:hypothetical protein